MVRTRPFFKTLTFLFLVAFLSACPGMRTAKRGKVSYPNAVTAPMQSEFNQAEELFRNRQFAQAALAYEAYVNRYPYNRFTDESNLRLGQIHLVKKNPGRAAEVLEVLIQKTPDPAVASRAQVKAAVARFRLKQRTQARSHVEKARAEHLIRADQRKVAAMGWELTRGAPLEKRAYYLALFLDNLRADPQRGLPKAIPSESFLKEKLNQWSTEPARLALVDPRFQSYPATESAPYVHWKLAQSYAQAGKKEEARWQAKRLISRYPNFQYTPEARTLMASLGKSKRGSQKKGQLVKVGVLLPLSGKYQKFGLSTLQGMECGASLKPSCQGVTNLKLIVRDDAGDATKAVALVEELVKQENVSLLLGPLSSASAVAAAKKAQELGVPMLSLAQKAGIPSLGNHIFRFSLTPDQQAKALLLLASKKQGVKQVAVLYPNNQYGRVFFKKFSEHAPRYDINVLASQSYKDPRDLQEELRQLRLSTTQATADRPYGFEALFIPDSFAAVAAIVTQLDWAGFKNLKLHGTNAWNDARLATLESELLKEAVFVDLYFKDSKKPEVVAFRQDFRQAFGKDPSTLEAMGFDVVRFVGEALQSAPPKTSALDALRQNQNYEGVTALRGFVSSQEAKLKPYFLGFSAGRIVELSK